MLTRMGLTRRLVLFAIVCVLVPLAATFGVAVVSAKHAVREQVRSRNLLYTKALAKRVDSVLRGLVNELQLAVQGASATELDVEAIHTNLESTLSKQRLLRYVRIVDASGEVKRHLPYPREGDVIPSVEQAFGVVQWSRVPYFSDVYSAAGGQMVLAVPILGKGDRFLGALVAGIEPAALGELLWEVSMGPNAFALLIDRRGTIVGESRGRWRGQSIAAHPVGQDLYLERHGAEEADFMGARMLLAYQPLGLMPWGLVVGEPLTDALAPVYRLIDILLKGFLGIVILAVVGILLGAVRVVRPLKELISFAHDLRQGMLWKRTEVSADGEVSVLAHALNEMADALQREQELVLRKEQYLEDLLQGIPYCILTTDNKGRVTFMNRAAEELTGWEAEDAVGCLAAEMPFKERPDDWVLLESLRSPQPILDRETYLLSQTGQRVTVHLQATRLYDREGTAIGAVAVFRNITEQKELESLVQRNERLSALGQLTAGIAHELKNPLAIVCALTQTMQEEMAGGQDPAPLLDDLVEETHRMDALLRDLLEFSRGGSYKQAPCGLAEVVGHLLTLLRHQAARQQVTVHQEYEQDLPPVMADRARLRQALLNILNNALEAMPAGGTLRVRVAEAERNGRRGVAVSISDTGPGIPAKRLDRIFNPFYSTKQEGTGLGLAIVHEIMTQHGGVVTAESSEHQGATFTCWLPLVSSQEGRDLP